jgi:hypothetical protein
MYSANNLHEDGLERTKHVAGVLQQQIFLVTYEISGIKYCIVTLLVGRVAQSV